MYKKLIVASFIFNIFFGAFMFVFGGADDSPGAQLLGALAVVISVFGLIILMRNKLLSGQLSKRLPMTLR